MVPSERWFDLSIVPLHRSEPTRNYSDTRRPSKGRWSSLFGDSCLLLACLPPATRQEAPVGSS